MTILINFSIKQISHSYDASSKVGLIDLLGSVSPRYPPQYVMNKNVNITQFLYNTCGQPVIKFKPIKENVIYKFLGGLSSRLLNYLTEKGRSNLAEYNIIH